MRDLKVFECPECKSKNVFMDKLGKCMGLFCGDCRAWIKWLDEDEIELAQRQIEMGEKELDELIESLTD